MNNLYAEVIASIVAAAVLGLIVGWMIRGSRAKKHIKSLKAKSARKVSKLETAHANEIEQLETKLQSVGEDIRELTAKNRQLSAQDPGTGTDKARSDAIELNRKQAELQERMQRIIRQKDREIEALKSQTSQAQASQEDRLDDTAPIPGGQPARELEVEAYIDNLTHQRKRDHDDSLSSPAKIAAAASSAAMAAAAANTMIDPDDTIADDDDFDATTVLREDTLIITPNELDTTQDDTFNGIDEATIVMDEATLAEARSRRTSKD